MINKKIIKEFLKPDWRKALIFLIMLIVSISLGGKFGAICIDFPKSNISTCKMGCGETALLFLPLWPLSFFTPCTTLQGLFIDVFSQSNILFYSVLLNIPYWYLLSCLLIFGWNKFKDEKQ